MLGRDIPILIQGESGAGKEMFAKAFHNSGPRRDGALRGAQLRRHSRKP